MDGLRFSVSLEDQVSPASKAAAKALKDMQNELTGAKKTLTGYQDQLRRMNELKEFVPISLLKSIDDQKRKVLELQSAINKVGPVSEEASSHWKFSLEGMGTTIDRLAERAVEGAAIMGAAIVGALGEGVKIALEATEVNERLSATFEALGDHAGAGKETLQFLNELSTQLPQSRDQLAKWTTQYQALGITDLGELRAQITATASAQAIGGDEAASAYEHLTQKVHLAVEEHKGLKLGEKTLVQLYEAGINATDIADRLGISTNELGARLKSGSIDAQKFGNAMTETLIAKGKGPLEAMGNEIGTLKEKGWEAFSHLFDGLDATPITDVIKNFTGLFDQSTDVGQAMKKEVGGGIQHVVNWLGKMMTEAEITFLNIATWVVKNKGEIKAMFESGVSVGGAFIKVLEGVATVLGVIGKAAIGVGTSIGWVGDKLGLVDHGGAALTPEQYDAKYGKGGGGALPGTAPAHAEGGLVQRPAPGEFFASVAPGEYIMPQREAQQILGGSARETASAANANGGGASGGVHVDKLEIHIVAPHGVTDAQSLSITGLSLAFERLQLASGR